MDNNYWDERSLDEWSMDEFLDLDEQQHLNNLKAQVIMENEMNNESNKRHKWADVIIAWANGEEIQHRNVALGTTEWHDYEPPIYCANLDSLQAEWRIKPKKKTGWINIFQEPIDISGPYKTKEDADKHHAETGQKYGYIRVACIQITYEEGEGL